MADKGIPEGGDGPEPDGRKADVQKSDGRKADGQKTDGQKTDIHVSLIGGTRLRGAVIQERTLTASLIGGADIDLTEVDIPDGAELKIIKLSLVGGVRLRVREDVRVVVGGIRLGGVSDDGPSVPGGPTVHVNAWGLLGGVSVVRG